MDEFEPLPQVRLVPSLKKICLGCWKARMGLFQTTDLKMNPTGM